MPVSALPRVILLSPGFGAGTIPLNLPFRTGETSFDVNDAFCVAPLHTEMLRPPEADSSMTTWAASTARQTPGAGIPPPHGFGGEHMFDGVFGLDVGFDEG